MTIEQIIQAKINSLSADKQAEILNLLDSLIASQSEAIERQEYREWSQFSLDRAMEGLADDCLPEYTEKDLKEKWQ